jgi:hypothetical protein
MLRKIILPLAISLAAGLGCGVLTMPGSGGAPDPASGMPNNTAMTRDQHQALFPILAGAHATTDCNSCHGGFSSFKEFTCIGCHDHAQQPTDMGHVGVVGYRYDSKACVGCHPQGVAAAVSRPDHSTKFFPIDVGTAHANGQCSDCHTNAADKSQFTCISCHDHAQPATDTGHVGVAGYKYDSAACLSCHPQGLAGTISRPDHTKFFPIDVGTVHANGQCTDCHTNAADKSQFTCISCHDHAQSLTDPGHVGVNGYKYDSKACLTCHPQGVAGTISRPDHAKFFAIDVGTTHAAAQCSDCHKNLADKTQFTCMTACHAQAPMATTHKGVAVYQYDSKACLVCHPQGQASLSRADHKKYMNISSGDHNVACSHCHKTADYKVRTCLDCHSSNNP